MVNVEKSVVRTEYQKIRKFQPELTDKIIVLISIKLNFPMPLYVLFCKDLMVNVEKSVVRTFTLFPKHVILTRTGRNLNLY